MGKRFSFVMMIMMWVTILPWRAEPAGAAEIATLSGRPDFSLEFVRRIVTESRDLAPGIVKDDWNSTVLAYLLFVHEVGSVSNFEIIEWDGTSSTAWLHRAMREGATRAPVVTHDFTPETSGNCRVMASLPRTAFVLSMGEGGSREPLLSECDLDNVLRVAALDESEGDLMRTSNFGDGARIAARGQRLPVVGSGGDSRITSGTALASAIVAGELAVYARNHSALRGASLIQEFLLERTTEVSTLKGRVRGSRAFLTRNGR